MKLTQTHVTDRLGISSRRSTVYIALLLSSFLCAALIASRVWYSGTLGYVFLLWNLFLAWIPLIAAVRLYDCDRRGTLRWTSFVLGGVWLLFYPNAPYILTDLIHLVEHPSQLIWFDLVLFMSFAWTGMLLGFVSLSLVQSVVRRRLGTATGWAFVILVTGIGSFGIYLGRFLRWNSWDVLTDPRTLFTDIWVRIVNPTAHAQTFAVSLLLSGFLFIAYLVVVALMQGFSTPQKVDS